ncbi:hypothetical protein BTO32_15490 [Marinobacter lutaoensis]|uniref:Type 4 secretion system PilS N-terminal domain-containing protein n=1 Tax=Marinobacter lutaoensis TaxID=135739 RepID=A0A1V2DPL1_9GAMM|nr:type 4 pilus major pilin [Marinobacter lutaoensis]ONF42608.1 hypothetical protein BTO32_15490 [Marinobacter lutaoensis]
MKHTIYGGRVKGFTLIEALLVLGIFAVAIAFLAPIAISESASQRAKSEGQIIAAIGKKIQSIYDRPASYAGLTTTRANQLNVFPESMGDPAVNSFGAQVAVQTPPDNPKTPTANGARQFQIDWPGVTADVCSELASDPLGAIGVDVDGVEVYNRGVSDVDIGAIAANCEDGVTVSFIFGKN